MFRKITACLSLFSLVLVSLAPLATYAAPATKKQGNSQGRAFKKLAPEFEVAGNTSATVRVLIQTKGQPSAAHDAAVASARGSKRAAYASLNTVVADVPANQVATLAARADVVYVSPDRPVKATFSLTNETIGASKVQASATAPGLSGKGVGIAILDSGVSANHPDFAGANGKSRVVASVDFTGSARTGDADGHGTGVAGVAASNGAASAGLEANYAGVATGASIIDVRVLDEHGVGRTSNVLAGLNWAIENSKKYNIRVINISLGAPVRESFHTDPLCKGVEHAVRSGIVVVASAGNMGRTEEVIGQNADGSNIYKLAYGTISSPGNSPYAITVGASDSRGTVKRSDDVVASFSSKGFTRFDHLGKPDVVAPGRKVVAPMSQEPNPTLANQYPDRVVSNAYFNYSGTSRR